MTAWQRLGIEPTDNQREIKKAYAKQLKLIDQDTQPEEFMANSNMRCDSLKSLMIINKLSKFL
ncbi:hypothetical protein [Acinetobacter baumannii]|uniref:hypothetical protein n=1 Tax=Acinetobacter baumannii TaxID=470 RepID=UPI000F65A657|nr:hypothetical protein EGU08_16025 [Acinetobacter baumannii]RSF56253.1 hypothetical protein EGU00_16240 [Acinetobacter baumannii]